MHEHEQTHESEGGAYSRRHLFIMALCCLIPIALLIAVVYANIESTYLPFLLVLLCPVFMFLMYLSRTLPKKKRMRETHP